MMVGLGLLAAAVLVLCARDTQSVLRENEGNPAANRRAIRLEETDDTAHHIEKRSSGGFSSGGFGRRRFRSFGRGGRFRGIGRPFSGAGAGQFLGPGPGRFFGPNSFSRFQFRAPSTFFFPRGPRLRSAVDLNIFNKQRMRGSRVKIVDHHRKNNYYNNEERSFIQTPRRLRTHRRQQTPRLLRTHRRQQTPIFIFGPPGRRPGGMKPGGMVPGGMIPGGMEPGGMIPGGMEPGGMIPGGMEPGGMIPGGMEPGGMIPGGMEPGGMEPGGMEPGGMEPGSMEPGGMEPGGM